MYIPSNLKRLLNYAFSVSDNAIMHTHMRARANTHTHAHVYTYIRAHMHTQYNQRNMHHAVVNK